MTSNVLKHNNELIFENCQKIIIIWLNPIINYSSTLYFFIMSYFSTLICFTLNCHFKVQGKKALKKKCLLTSHVLLGADSTKHFLENPKLKQTLTHKHWTKRGSSLKRTSPSSSETHIFCGTTHRWADTILSHLVHCASRDHLNFCIYAVNNLSINNGVEPGTEKAPVGVSGVVCALEIIADSVIPSQPPELRLCFWTVEVSLLMFCSIFIKKTLSAQSMLS